MILPIILSLLPTLIKGAENLLPGPGKGHDKKEMVMTLVSGLYDKFLKNSVPDLPLIDEKAVILEIASLLIDFLVDTVMTKNAGPAPQ